MKNVMCKFTRCSKSALKTIWLVFAIVIIISQNWDALAQAKQNGPAASAPRRSFIPVEEVLLNEAQVSGYAAAVKEIKAVAYNEDTSSPETIAKLDAISKKHGLADYSEYKRVGDTVGLIAAGIDDVTRKFVGRDKLLKAEIANTKANKKMSAAEKEGELDRLNDQLELAFPEVRYKGNIELVRKHYDEIKAALVEPGE